MFGGLVISSDPSGISYLDVEEENPIQGPDPSGISYLDVSPKKDPINPVQEADETIIEEPIKNVKIKKCDFEAQHSTCKLSAWGINKNIKVNGIEYRVIYKPLWNENIFYVGNSMYHLEERGAFKTAEFEIDGRLFELRKSGTKIIIRESN